MRGHTLLNQNITFPAQFILEDDCTTYVLRMYRTIVSPLHKVRLQARRDETTMLTMNDDGVDTVEPILYVRFEMKGVLV